MTARCATTERYTKFATAIGFRAFNNTAGKKEPYQRVGPTKPPIDERLLRRAKRAAKLRNEWRVARCKRVQLRIVSVMPRVCRLDGRRSSARPQPPRSQSDNCSSLDQIYHREEIV